MRALELTQIMGQPCEFQAVLGCILGLDQLEGPGGPVGGLPMPAPPARRSQQPWDGLEAEPAAVLVWKEEVGGPPHLQGVETEAYTFSRSDL